MTNHWVTDAFANVRSGLQRLAATKVGRAVWPVSSRSQALISLGVLFICLGYLYLPPKQTPALLASLRTINAIIPVTVFGWVFITIGVLSVVAGLLRRGKRAAFMAVSGLTSCWASAWLIESTWFIGDSDRGIVNALVFGTLTVYIWRSSGTGERR